MLTVILGIIVSGCIDGVHGKSNDSGNRLNEIYYQELPGPTESMRIIHDDVNNVTCYAYKNGYGAGLSCFLDSELPEHGQDSKYR